MESASMRYETTRSIEIKPWMVLAVIALIVVLMWGKEMDETEEDRKIRLRAGLMYMELLVDKSDSRFSEFCKKFRDDFYLSRIVMIYDAMSLDDAASLGRDDSLEYPAVDLSGKVVSADSAVQYLSKDRIRSLGLGDVVIEYISEDTTCESLEKRPLIREYLLLEAEDKKELAKIIKEVGHEGIETSVVLEKCQGWTPSDEIAATFLKEFIAYVEMYVR